MGRRCFEDLIAWQIARTLAADVHTATAARVFEADPTLRDRLRATAGSIMTSLAAGSEQRSCRDFAEHLSQAAAAAAELRSLIYLAGDVALLDKTTAERLRGRAQILAEATQGLRAAAARYGSVIHVARTMSVN